MEHLAQDLSLALEDSEPCGPANFKINRRWGIKRRTRSAGNLHLCLAKGAENNSDDSTSSNNEIQVQNPTQNSFRAKHSSLHQSDSDDMSFSLNVAKTLNKNHSLRMRNNIPTFVTLHGKHSVMNKISYSLESDSFNENSPARPNIRRKRKLKRMCVDEIPIPPCGKRKRPQTGNSNSFKSLKNSTKLKPLNPSIINKLENICAHHSNDDDATMMETQCTADENIEDHEQCEVASESSISLSGGEGHEGDDELTDWAPPPDPPVMDCFNDDPREIRAGCRRLYNGRPGFSITTGANERVARFLQDTARSELRLCGAERDKLGQLATLYSLDLWFEGPNSLLRKTSRTPCMQPPQRHHSGLAMGHKKICTHETKFV